MKGNRTRFFFPSLISPGVHSILPTQDTGTPTELPPEIKGFFYLFMPLKATHV